MISIITWVNNNKEYKRFCDSIYFDSEFIAVYKAESMSDAYTIGQAKASCEIKIYCHQDIEIKDKFLDKKLIEIFENKEIGFVGVIGNTKMNQSSWWLSERGNLVGHITQEDKKGIKKSQKLLFSKGNCEAVHLDGLFLATNKKWIFPLELPHIHFFDLWMCNESINKGYKNWIVDTDITHYSWGEDTSEQFKTNHKIYLEKWKELLQ